MLAICISGAAAINAARTCLESGPPAAGGVGGIRGAAVTIAAADSDRTGAPARR